MNQQEAERRVVAQLMQQPGWGKHPVHPFHYRHEAAGVHVMIYPTELSVVFGAPGRQYDKAVSASTRHFPALAIASVVDVAHALVEVALPAGVAQPVETAARQQSSSTG